MKKRVIVFLSVVIFSLVFIAVVKAGNSDEKTSAAQIGSLTVTVLPTTARPDMNTSLSTPADTIIDSDMSFEEAMKGTKAPEAVYKTITMITVHYIGYDGKLHRGQIVLYKDYVKEVSAIFDSLLVHKFPIEKVIPIVKYDWSDRASMTDNNTSSFNYRTVAGTTKMSDHAYGKAIDFNPRYNPYVKGTYVSPPNGEYNAKNPGTILAGSYADKLIKSFGWSWGGDWTDTKDYQHYFKK